MRIDPDTCTDPDLLAAEVRRLQAVIDSGETTLTDAERDAIQAAAVIMDARNRLGPVMFRGSERAAALRGLLERTCATDAE